MAKKTTVLAEKIRELRAKTSYWPPTLRLIWVAAPRWTVAWASLLVLQGILPVATVYLTKLVVDSMVAAMRAGGDWKQVRPTILLVILTGIVLLLVEALQAAIDWVRTAQSELIQDHIKGLVHQQSFAVDLAFYQSPEFHDRLDQARGEASSRPLALLESCGSVVQNTITLVAMAAVLIPYSPWLPFVLLISTLPAFYVMLRFDRHYHQWWQQSTQDRREAQYYDFMLTDAGAAPELRLFDLGDHFQATYRNLRNRLRTERLRQIQKQGIAKLGGGAGAVLLSGATMAWMIWRAIHGLATLGDLALFYQAFSRGQDLMRSLLGSLGKIYSNTLYLENLFAFLELKPNIVSPEDPLSAPLTLKSGVDFRHVTFRYPDSDRAALDNFTLSIPVGKIVAIVGANGAGKSTLLKLLCRFYDPQVGQVEIDGIDVRKLSITELWRMITVLFQFPVNYQSTVKQSIAYGDMNGNVSLSEIASAAHSAGAHEIISRLPEAYNTRLGKWFVKGVELSGGEWQRIAMARAYLRKTPIILLDEPTSFMDSWSESDWFDRFRALSLNRTALLITHRFTIAARADIIHVMDCGQLVESGSHRELLAQGGLYAQSWLKQMQTSGRHEDEVTPPVFAEGLSL